jgi:hypothetical protein
MTTPEEAQEHGRTGQVNSGVQVEGLAVETIAPNVERLSQIDITVTSTVVLSHSESSHHGNGKSLNKREIGLRICMWLITVILLSSLVPTVTLFDWKKSIAVELCLLALFLQSYFLSFHRDFKLARNCKYFWFLLSSVVIIVVETTSFQSLSFEDTPSFFKSVQVLSENQNMDYGQCTPVTDPKLSEICSGSYFAGAGISSLNVSTISDTFDNMVGFWSLIQGSGNDVIFQTCIEALKKLTCAWFFPTCNYQCQNTKICYSDCRRVSELIHGSDQCRGPVYGILFTQRSGAELLIDSFTQNSGDSSAFSSGFFQLLEGVWNNCTSDIVESEFQDSCSTTSSTKYFSGFESAQVGQGNCDATNLYGSLETTQELDNVRMRSYKSKISSACSFRIIFNSMSTLVFSLFIEYLSRKRTKTKPSFDVFVTRLEPLDVVSLSFCVLGSIILAVILLLTMLSCFNTSRVDVGFIVLASIIVIIHETVLLISICAHKNVPESFHSPLQAAKKQSHKGSIISLIGLFKEHFGRDGKLEKFYLLGQLLFQITLQTILLALWFSSSDIVTVAISSIIIFFDLTIAPWFLLSTC